MKRRVYRLCLIVPILAHLAGCAVHPLPEDYSGVSTFHIARQIRCETREAVIKFIIDLLTEGKNDNKVDAVDEEVGLKYKRGDAIINDFRPDQLKGKARKYVEIIWNTAIVYNYNLDMTETNNFDSSINILSALSVVTKASGFKSGYDRTRQNTRTFSITDDFGQLVSKVQKDYCDKFIVQEKTVYPITGRIGMFEVIREFMNLTVFGNLAGDGTKSVVAPPGPPTMADQLSFTTAISFQGTPKVTFTPIMPNLHVADFSLDLSTSRKDIHKLTIGLAVPAQAVPRLDRLRNAVFVGLITANAQTEARHAAAVAADQLITQKLLQRTIVVAE